MLVSNDVMLQMLKLSEFQNPLTGLNFQGTGTLSTPLGAKLLRTSAVPAGKLIGLDKNYALEHIIDSFGEVSVKASEDDPTVCLVEFSFAVAHGLNRIYLSAHITV